jgi:hypothetical protein
MEITTAKYIQDESGNNAFIKVTNSQTQEPDGNGSPEFTITVPLDPANTHYAEIMRQVAAGDLTIADAD